VPGSQNRSQTKISSLSAAISDVRETDRVLADVPQAREIREKLSEPLLFQHWDEITQRAIWIASDGNQVRCVTVTGLSAYEMSHVWVSFNERISRAKFNLSAQLVRDIIEAEIDVPVTLVN
jgi:hypothetical protein